MPVWSTRRPRLPKATATERLPGRRARAAPGRRGGGACCSSGTLGDRAGGIHFAEENAPASEPGWDSRRGEKRTCTCFFFVPTEGDVRCLHGYVRCHNASLSHALRRLALVRSAPPPGAGRDDVSGAGGTWPAHAARAGWRGGAARDFRNWLLFPAPL